MSLRLEQTHKPPQGVSVFDHAGIIIKFSLQNRAQLGAILTAWLGVTEGILPQAESFKRLKHHLSTLKILKHNPSPLDKQNKQPLHLEQTIKESDY